MVITCCTWQSWIQLAKCGPSIAFWRGPIRQRCLRQRLIPRKKMLQPAPSRYNSSAVGARAHAHESCSGCSFQSTSGGCPKLSSVPGLSPALLRIRKLQRDFTWFPHRCRVSGSRSPCLLRSTFHRCLNLYFNNCRRTLGARETPACIILIYLGMALFSFCLRWAFLNRCTTEFLCHSVIHLERNYPPFSNVKQNSPESEGHSKCSLLKYFRNGEGSSALGNTSNVPLKAGGLRPCNWEQNWPQH